MLRHHLPTKPVVVHAKNNSKSCHHVGISLSLNDTQQAFVHWCFLVFFFDELFHLSVFLFVVSVGGRVFFFLYFIILCVFFPLRIIGLLLLGILSLRSYVSLLHIKSRLKEIKQENNSRTSVSSSLRKIWSLRHEFVVSVSSLNSCRFFFPFSS